MPVFIKPLVTQEMTQYRDGYGNKREWRAYNKSLGVSKVQLIPQPGSKTLTYRCVVKSEEKRDPNNSIGMPKHKVSKTGKIKRGDKPKKTERYVNYLVTVRFHEMDFVPNESKQYAQKWKVEGKDTFTRTPTIARNPVMMKCQCRDFTFTWEKSLAENGGLWPNNVWQKYVRLTPLSEIPPRNPKEKMGYCKHIATLLTYMNDSGLVKNK